MLSDQSQIAKIISVLKWFFHTQNKTLTCENFDKNKMWKLTQNVKTLKNTYGNVKTLINIECENFDKHKKNSADRFLTPKSVIDIGCKKFRGLRSWKRNYGTFFFIKNAHCCVCLKGQSHEIFCTQFFSSISSFWSH